VESVFRSRRWGVADERRIAGVSQLGADVDLVPAPRRYDFSRRNRPAKRRLLSKWLLPFKLNLTGSQTRHGFHIIFRIMPQESDADVREAEALNAPPYQETARGRERRIAHAGPARPGTFQFKDPEHPFLCRLLLDNASTIPPKNLRPFALFSMPRSNSVGPERAQRPPPPQQSKSTSASCNAEGRSPRCARGARQCCGRLDHRCDPRAVAPGVVGNGGWAGLKEWNSRNPCRFPERELRAVFLSIAGGTGEEAQREKRNGSGETRARALAKQVAAPRFWST